MIEEIKFVLKCQGNTKPVRQRNNSSNQSKNSFNSDPGESSLPSLAKLELDADETRNGFAIP